MKKPKIKNQTRMRLKSWVLSLTQLILSVLILKPEEPMSKDHQDVFPRSYQYDLDCVHYRRIHECDVFKEPGGHKKPHKAHCRHCKPMRGRGLTPFQLAWAEDPGQRRWRYYPDLTTSMTADQIRAQMNELGRPYQNEACNWYYQNYPPRKIDCIIRKFSK